MKLKFSIAILSLMLIISSCKDKDDNKQLHAIIDSLQNLMPHYNAEKMIAHYKEISPAQKASTQKFQIDFQKMTLLLSNLHEKNSVSLELAAYDSADAQLYLDENKTVYHAEYPSDPELTLADIIHKPTVLVKIIGSVSYLNLAKICPPPSNCGPGL